MVSLARQSEVDHDYSRGVPLRPLAADRVGMHCKLSSHQSLSRVPSADSEVVLLLCHHNSVARLSGPSDQDRVRRQLHRTPCPLLQYTGVLLRRLHSVLKWSEQCRQCAMTARTIFFLSPFYSRGNKGFFFLLISSSFI